MQIRATDEIGGVTLVRIRELFRQAGLDGILCEDFVGRQLQLPKSRAGRLIAALRRTGLLEPIEVGRIATSTAESAWRLTKDGIRLRAATAARPLRRETADRLLSQLIQRIRALNSDDRFLARVQKAVVFGSYLGDADRIGDLDVAVEIVRREPDFDRHREANDRRVSEEFARGRRFSNMLEEAFWWQREATLFLRNRKRGLSLHDYGAIWEIVNRSPHRVVFPASNPGCPSKAQ